MDFERWDRLANGLNMDPGGDSGEGAAVQIDLEVDKMNRIKQTLAMLEAIGKHLAGFSGAQEPGLDFRRLSLQNRRRFARKLAGT